MIHYIIVTPGIPIFTVNYHYISIFYNKKIIVKECCYGIYVVQVKIILVIEFCHVGTTCLIKSYTVLIRSFRVDTLNEAHS